MERVILDTDVASFIFKADTRAELYQPHVDGRELVLSFMSVGELRLWALESRWGSRRQSELENFIRRTIVHPFTDAITRAWARIT